MNDLFPPDEGRADSPRLKWMRKHQVITHYSPLHGDWIAGCRDYQKDWDHKCDDDLDVLFWEGAYNGHQRLGQGTTEDEALADLAQKIGVRLWFEEEQ